MRGQATLGLFFVALGAGCAHGEELSEPERGSAAPASTSNGSNPGTPFNVTPSGSGGAGASAPFGKGGAAPSSGGSADASAGSNALSGGSGGSGGNAGFGGSRVDNGAASGAAGASSATPGDCPAATRVRLQSGECVDRITEFSVATTPTSIATGSDGRLWFDDGAGNQLVQLDSQGHVVNRYPFETPSVQRELIAGSGEVILWYTDAQARTLSKRTAAALTSYQLDFVPAGLARGNDEQVWLTEAGQAVYQVRTMPFGLTRFPTPASGGIIVGPDQNLWFPNGPVISRLTPDGHSDDFAISGFANDLCAGADGALWFTDGGLDQIGHMQTDGTLSRTYDLPPASNPFRIIAGPDGALWFTEKGGNRIGKITLKGDITHYPIPTADAVPFALTAGADRNIWFTESYSGKIGRLIPDSVE